MESSPADSQPAPLQPERLLPAIGDQVRLLQSPAYLKTADPMPMLRPPDLVDSGERGEVVGLRALEQVAVRFRRGTFLLESRQLEILKA